MKSLVALSFAAAALVSTTAFASTGANGYAEAVTGKVVVNQPRCFTAPCPPMVMIQDGENVVHVKWGSKLGDDLAGFQGKVVTVQGAMKDGSLDPQAFKPGTSKNFVTGTIHTRCMNGAATCRAFIEVNGQQYMIHDDFKNYAGLDGATVSLQGTLKGNCPAGAMCITNIVEFYPSSNTIMVKGELGVLYTALGPTRPIVPQAGNYLLKFDNGNTMIVDSKRNLMDRNGSTVWLRGHLNAGGGDLASFFTATAASDAVYSNAPMTMAGTAAGNNAGRNDSTVPVASAQPSGSSSQGAGVAH